MSTNKTISRKTKGAIAAVAGGALLLGTGATFAVWSASDTLTGNTITAGRLALNDANIVWEYSNDGNTWKNLPNDYLMIPGQTVRGTAAIDADLAGTDLTATLAFAGGAQTNTFTDAVVKWKLGGVEKTGPVANISVPNLTPATAAPVGATDLVVEISLPKPGADNNADNNAVRTAGNQASWSLANATVTLTQN